MSSTGFATANRLLRFALINWPLQFRTLALTDKRVTKLIPDSEYKSLTLVSRPKTKGKAISLSLCQEFLGRNHFV